MYETISLTRTDGEPISVMVRNIEAITNSVHSDATRVDMVSGASHEVRESHESILSNIPRQDEQLPVRVIIAGDLR